MLDRYVSGSTATSLRVLKAKPLQKLVLLLGLLVFCATLQAQEASAPAAAPDGKPASPSFFDKNGDLDIGEWLLSQKGFLPVPIIITEPAVGYGAGLAIGFFSQSMGEAIKQSQSTGHVTPPDIYGVAAAATQNGSRFGGGGAFLTFLDDRWRYRGMYGLTDVNLDFYGTGPLFDRDYKVGYSLNGWGTSQQVLYRLGETSNFLALRWVYLDLSSTFETGRPRLPDPSFATKTSGLGVSWERDTRNTMFTPSRGMITAIDTLFYSPSLGSDNTFQTYRARMFSYLPLGNSVVLGTRLDGRTARGDVPFYQLPFIALRGIPAARYQDENVVVGELEARWTFTERWSLVGFGGVGKAWGQTHFDEAKNRFSGGTGFRYELARILGLWAGLDFAWGPDGEQAFYIQVGNAWR